jgi:hypothetical protein
MAPQPPDEWAEEPKPPRLTDPWEPELELPMERGLLRELQALDEWVGPYQ